PADPRSSIPVVSHCPWHTRRLASGNGVALTRDRRNRNDIPYPRCRVVRGCPQHEFSGGRIATMTPILRPMSLERFHEAQASRSAGYDTALAEIRAGCKRSHWIWYIFPQIEGLGRSSTARAYALRDLGEACAYLRDPILRARYEEIVAAVGEQ